MQLYHLYKQYGQDLFSSREFQHIWDKRFAFKICNNRITVDKGNRNSKDTHRRDVIHSKLQEIFDFETINNELHHKIIQQYFIAMKEMYMSENLYVLEQSLDFTVNRVRISNKNSVIVRKHNDLRRNHKVIFNDRLVFNSGLMVHEDSSYVLYTVMANHGSSGFDNEHMKFSYYVRNDKFYFIAPKISKDPSALFVIDINEIEQNFDIILNSIKKKIFTMFYKKLARALFGQNLRYSTLRPVHLAIIDMLDEQPIDQFSSFTKNQIGFNFENNENLSDNDLYTVFKNYLAAYLMFYI